MEVLEHVLGIKKYKNCFGKFDREARQISLEPRKTELLLLTAVAPASGIGRANKLAEVVEQVLGVKKPFTVLENSVGNPSNEAAKNRTHQNSLLRGRIASPGTGRVLKLSYFCKKLVPSS